MQGSIQNVPTHSNIVTTTNVQSGRLPQHSISSSGGPAQQDLYVPSRARTARLVGAGIVSIGAYCLVVATLQDSHKANKQGLLSFFMRVAQSSSFILLYSTIFPLALVLRSRSLHARSTVDTFRFVACVLGGAAVGAATYQLEKRSQVTEVDPLKFLRWGCKMGLMAGSPFMFRAAVTIL